MVIDDRKSFIQGIGYAVARLVQMYDEPGMAQAIIHESGYSLGDFAEVCDEADMPLIKKAWYD